MLIIRKIKEFPTINGLEHINTSWVLSYDKESNDVITEISNSVEYKHHFEYDLSIPVDDILYLKAIRHFNDPNAEYESELMTIRFLEKEYSNMIHTEETVIDEPIVVINKDDILNDKETFTINTSMFRCNNDGHTHTHWFIIDNNKKIMFKSMYNTVNKTSIEVNKDKSYIGMDNLTIVAIHCSNNKESPIGKTELSFNNFNFTLNKDIYNVIKTHDFKLRISKIEEHKPNLIQKIELLNTDNILLKLYETNEPNEINIPTTLLQEQDKYLFIDIYAYGITGSLNKLRYRLDLVDDLIDDNYDSNIPFFGNNITLVNDDFPSEISNHQATRQLINGDIPILLRNKNKLSKFRYSNEGELYDTGMYIDGIDIPNTNKDIFIQQVYIDTILVDTYNNEDKPTFMLFKKINNVSPYVHIDSLIRPNETKTVGYNNSIIRWNDNEYMYVTNTSSSLLKLDINTMSRTEVTEVPLDMSSGAIIAKLNNGNILIISKFDFKSKIYSIKDDIFLEGVSINPGSFVNQDLKAVRLLNNDVAIFKINKSEGDVDNDIMILDQKELKLKHIDYKFNTMSNPSTTIELLNSTVFMTGHNIYDPVLDIPANTSLTGINKINI